MSRRDVTTREIETLIEYYEKQLRDYKTYSGEDAEAIIAGFKTRLAFWRKQNK